MNLQKLTDLKKHPISLLANLAVHLSITLTMFLLIAIVGYILVKGLPYITPNFFSLKYTTDNVSAMPSIINTLIIVLITLLIATPLGIFCAIYLCEYAKSNSTFVKIIRLTTETLAGIPSIIYGLFGAIFFVDFCHIGKSLLAGALTLTIMVLPLLIRTSEEALLSVDPMYKEGSYGLGAGKLRTLFKIILPSAIPGILSGIILSIGRIVGETAAIIYTAGSNTDLMESVFSAGRTLSVHMYLLSTEGLYTDKTYAAAVLLILLTIFINLLSNKVATLFKKGQM